MTPILYKIVFCLMGFVLASSLKAQQPPVMTKADRSFLEKLTKDILDSSKVYPGQSVSGGLGINNTGGVIIKPGAGDMYPSFWIRDYAMSIETGFIAPAEQKHMLLLTANTQCDQSWITKGGSLVPLGSIADHILVNDSKPIYFPGTYSYEDQGTPRWGTLPPYCDQFFFVHMAYYYVKTTGDLSILSTVINGKKLLDRLKLAFHTPPSNESNHIVLATKEMRGVDFGFRDAIEITGLLCYPTILKYRAALELSEIMAMLKFEEASRYKEIANMIKENLHQIFMNEEGMLLASTGQSNQPDIWSTALAIYYEAMEEEYVSRASKALCEAYKAGEISYKGNIRHVPTNADYDKNTAWEVTTVPKNSYQNGAYWGTPTGWVCYAIYKTDPNLAARLAQEFIQDLKENDYRKGGQYGAPYECFNKEGYQQNPLYLTTVSCPLISLRILPTE